MPFAAIPTNPSPISAVHAALNPSLPDRQYVVDSIQVPGRTGRSHTAAGYILLRSEAADGDKSHSPAVDILESHSAPAPSFEAARLPIVACERADPECESASRLAARKNWPSLVDESKQNGAPPRTGPCADGGPRAIVSRSSEMAVQRETQVTFASDDRLPTRKTRRARGQRRPRPHLVVQGARVGYRKWRVGVEGVSTLEFDVHDCPRSPQKVPGSSCAGSWSTGQTLRNATIVELLTRPVDWTALSNHGNDETTIAELSRDGFFTPQAKEKLPQSPPGVLATAPWSLLQAGGPPRCEMGVVGAWVTAREQRPVPGVLPIVTSISAKDGNVAGSLSEGGCRGAVAGLSTRDRRRNSQGEELSALP